MNYSEMDVSYSGMWKRKTTCELNLEDGGTIRIMYECCNEYGLKRRIFPVILLHEKFLQFDWLSAMVFQLNLKYLHVKIANLCG